MGSIVNGLIKPKVAPMLPPVTATPAVISPQEQAPTSKTSAADIAAEQQKVRKKLYEQSGRSSTNVTGGNGLSAKTYLGA